MLRSISNTLSVVVVLSLLIGCSAPKKQRIRSPKQLSPAALSFCQYVAEYKAYERANLLDDFLKDRYDQRRHIAWEGRVTNVSATGTFYTMVPLAGPKVECSVFASKTGVIPRDTVVGAHSTINAYIQSISVLSFLVNVKEPEPPIPNTL